MWPHLYACWSWREGREIGRATCGLGVDQSGPNEAILCILKTKKKNATSFHS